MKKMGSKTKLAVLLAVEGVVLIFIAVLVYGPSVAAVHEAQAALGDLAQRQVELCRTLETSPDVEAEIGRAKAEIRQMENRIPNEGRVNWLSGRVSGAMDEYGIILRSTTSWCESTTSPENPALKKLQKSVSVCSTAMNLQRFLDALGKMPFVLTVEDMQVKRDQKWGAVDATLHLATFVMRAQASGALAQATTPAGVTKQ